MDVVDLADNKEIFTTGGLLEKHLLFCFRHGEAVPIYQLHSRCLGFPFDGFMRLNPDLAAEWHPTKNNCLRPTQVTAGSNRKVWWKGTCGHEWEAVIGNRSRGIGCPHCSKRHVVEGVNDLVTVNPSLAAEWHPTKNGRLRPMQIAGKSNKKAWWLGKCGHEWEAAIYSRAVGKGCPYCYGKKER